ncbi:recombinase family protein [Pseudodesulfovibrio senegalensis]|uniref:Resolvase/invertase-type recombinase catalytic domain-containing protein n=1 Tax=Pseudodesulfovibrio senegalensis TaxID=1721087 RepID=A0A6N6N4V0_9BACT|nr:recombinase family protein [Pseudodesulfovibrio senegalensis]KAB1443076.1 hypothetical protein F8A88_02085 [Pseudodesulfovibrio senegalensis]
MCKVVAYARISTNKQDLDNQRHEVEAYAKSNGLTIDKWIATEESSRKTTTKRRIDELLTTLKRGDVLIVGELSRLGRSIRENLNIVHELHRKSINVHLVKERIQTNGESDAIGNMLIGNLSFAAELERQLISQRTKAALARLKADGIKLGNPRIKELHADRSKATAENDERLRPILTGLVMQGMTQRQIIAELDLQGIKTIRGNQWSQSTLISTMRRLGLKTKRTK